MKRLWWPCFQGHSCVVEVSQLVANINPVQLILGLIFHDLDSCAAAMFYNCLVAELCLSPEPSLRVP